MYLWFFLGLIITLRGHTDIDDDIPLLLPLEIELVLSSAPDKIIVKPHNIVKDLFTTTSKIHLKLIVTNPTPNPIMIDLDDTPLEAEKFEGRLPANFFSAESNVKWMGLESEFIENNPDGEKVKLKCVAIASGESMTADITLGANGNTFGFNKAEGSAKISFEVTIKECNKKNEFSGRAISLAATNAVKVTLAADPEEEKVGGWGKQWIGRGYVETDDDGIFYWVNTWNDPLRTWTHPSQPRTYTFKQGDRYEDCSDSITYNGVTKTLQEWIHGLEADKFQFCAAAIWHTQKRTDAFYTQFEKYFDWFSESRYDELKGKIARLCSADGYEYNCDPLGTCNMGLTYRDCHSVNPPYLYPIKCSRAFDDVDFTKQYAIVDLPQHKGTTLTQLRQDMYECSVDERNCKDGTIPRQLGGVMAYVDTLQDWEGGLRTINLCPIMFWMAAMHIRCNVKDIAEQQDPGHVFEYDKEKYCALSSSATIFHELGHMSDIADGSHSGTLENTYALAQFMAGFAEKPPPPPTPAPLTSKPTKRPTPSPTDPGYVQPSASPIPRPCEDGRYCYMYRNYVIGKPQSTVDYYCNLFSYPNGVYCQAYDAYCCPVMCGACDALEETEAEVAAQERPEWAKVGSFPKQTTWTHPEWLQITWEDSFPVVPAPPTTPRSGEVAANSLAESSIHVVQKFASESQLVSILAVLGCAIILLYIPFRIFQKYFQTDPYTTIKEEV